MKKKIIFRVCIGIIWFTLFKGAVGLPTGTGFYIRDPLSITQPGNYFLIDDLVGTVTIASDNVVLYLNNKKITNSLGRAISVTGQSEIVIRNGVIQDISTEGIYVDACSAIEITDVDFVGNATGLYILSSTGVMVTSCNFLDQSAVATPTATSYIGALVIDDSNNVLVQDCSCSDNINCFGILLKNNSHKNIIKNCICNVNQAGIYLYNDCYNNKIVDNTCDGNIVSNISDSGTGIYLNSGCSYNVLEGNSCSNNSAIATATSSGESVNADYGGSGIYLNSSCSHNVLSDNFCSNNSTLVSTTAGATASADYGGSGIYLNSSCSYNSIEENTCDDHSAGANTSSTGYGISVGTTDCNSNDINLNKCSQNSTGIYDNSPGTGMSIIYENICSLNSSLGLDSVTSTSVYDNKAVGNGTSYGDSVPHIKYPTNTITWGDNFADH